MSSRWASLAVVLVLFATSMAGCGGGSAAEPTKRVRAKPGAQSAAAKSALDDPASAPSKLADFWRHVRVGALPLALEYYDPEVQQGIGVGLLAGMLAAAQPSATAELRVLDVEPARKGQLVTAEILPAAGEKALHSFYMVRTDGEWRLRYDTFTANTLQSYAQGLTQRQIDPGAKAPAARATAAADDAVRRYRDVALDLDELEKLRRDK